MLGGDDGAVGGHRFGERDPEALSRRGRGEYARRAHVAEHVLVVVEEAEEVNSIAVGEIVGSVAEAVGFRAIPDDAERGVVVLNDLVECIQQERDVLIGDEASSKEDIVAVMAVGFWERCVAYLRDVDAVRDDLDSISGRADLAEAVGGDARHGDRVLRDAGGEVFGEFPEGGERAEVFRPVGAPDLVPRRDKRRVGGEAREFRREDGEVREDARDDHVVFVGFESFVERDGEAGGEVDGFRDRAAVVGVEVGVGCDGAEGDALVGRFSGAVPEVAAVDGDVVALVGEANADFVDAFLCAAGHEGMHHIAHKTNIHRQIAIFWSNSTLNTSL